MATKKAATKKSVKKEVAVTPQPEAKVEKAVSKQLKDKKATKKTAAVEAPQPQEKPAKFAKATKRAAKPEMQVISETGVTIIQEELFSEKADPTAPLMAGKGYGGEVKKGKKGKKAAAKTAAVANKPEEPASQADKFLSLDAAMRRVMIQRWPDQYTVIGPNVAMKTVHEAAEMLVYSKFMEKWLVEKVEQALLAGEKFCHIKGTEEDWRASNWRGRQDGQVSEYRLATEEEVLDAPYLAMNITPDDPREDQANHLDVKEVKAKRSKMTEEGDAKAAARKAAGKKPKIARTPKSKVDGDKPAYKLGKAPSADAKLPKQARAVLDILREKDATRDWSENAISLVLESAVKAGVLVTTQAPLRIFVFYAKKLIEDKFLVKL